MPRPIKIIIAGVDKFTGMLEQTMRGIDKVGSKMRNIGKKMTMGLTLPIVGLGIASVGFASSYQSSMERVRVLTGASTEQFSQLNQMASNIGKTTYMSSIQAAEGMKLMVNQGFSIQGVMGGLPGMIELSELAEIGLSDSIQVASTITKGYNKNINDMAKINDMLVVTARKGGIGVNELAQGLSSMSPVAQTFGVSMEDMLAVIGTLGSKGIEISKSLMGVKTALSSLVKPGNSAMEVFNKVGIKKGDIFTSEGKLKSLTDIFNTFSKAGLKSSDMVQIFGNRAGPIMSVLLSGGGKSLEDFKKNLTGVTGTADKLSAAIEMTTAERLEKFKALISTTAQTLGVKLLPAVNGILEKVSGWISKLGELNPKTLQTIMVIAGIVAAIGPLVLGIGGLIGALSQVVMGVKLLSSAFVFLATNPVGWIILGIAALIAITVLLIKNWDSVKKFFVTIWTFISKIFQSKIGLIITVFNPFLGLPLLIVANWEKVVGIFKTVSEWTGKVWDKFKNLIGANATISTKMGLVTPEGNAVPAGTLTRETANAGSQKTTVENKTKIVIDNKNDSRVRTSTDKGDVNLESYTGEVIPAY
jgi:TP901 family phage tail tape measure protein